MPPITGVPSCTNPLRQPGKHQPGPKPNPRNLDPAVSDIERYRKAFCSWVKDEFDRITREWKGLPDNDPNKVIVGNLIVGWAEAVRDDTCTLLGLLEPIFPPGQKGKAPLTTTPTQPPSSPFARSR